MRNGILTRFRKTIKVEKFIIEQHAEWIGDLKHQKVLDLGCYAGNSLSLYLAHNAKEYIAIDLSEPAITKLNKRLVKYPNARAEAIDFLSDDFRENNFDLIYAYGVLHHFKDVDELINILKSKLSEKGKIVSYDPTSTSKPVWLLRTIYRPFQSDRDWEWPFTESTIQKFSESFNLLDRRGVLGKSKWFFLLNLIPISSKKRTQIGTAWHLEDWEKSRKSDKHFLKCMQVSLYLQKK
ncbi:class I SAM-dependent methyltransferase [Gramella sp. AN32]|uniref:Class I SAM-dependent methyltransferase n=1 Tax=Christiangramia antarctica TaxID=2058158 RepID=A0ABW5X8J5_9FLAO|nr:class I SAM-dependent methyltransferase [Gramella sp. AN32]